MIDYYLIDLDKGEITPMYANQYQLINFGSNGAIITKLTSATQVFNKVWKTVFAEKQTYLNTDSAYLLVFNTKTYHLYKIINSKLDGSEAIIEIDTAIIDSEDY